MHFFKNLFFQKNRKNEKKLLKTMSSQQTSSAPLKGDPEQNEQSAKSFYQAANERSGNTLGRILASLFVVLVIAFLYLWSVSELHGAVVDRLSEGRNSILNVLVGPAMACLGLIFAITSLTMIFFTTKARTSQPAATAPRVAYSAGELTGPSQVVVYGVSALAIAMLTITLIVSAFHSRSEDVYRGFLYITVFFYVMVLGLAVYNFTSSGANKDLTRYVAHHGASDPKTIEVANYKAGALVSLILAGLGSLQAIASIYVLVKTDGTQVVPAAITDLNTLRLGNDVR
jgi:hypothetical protein